MTLMPSLDFRGCVPNLRRRIHRIEQACKPFFGEGERKFTAEQRRVSTFLWQDRTRTASESLTVVSRYAARGRDGPRAAAGPSSGSGLRGHAARFGAMDFSQADLSGGVFSGLRFTRLRFRMPV